MSTNSQLSQLSNDGPLLNPDQDQLHRSPFAEHLAQSIRSINPSDGFVFALTGPWGSGKTTVLNFTEKLLEDQSGEGNDSIEIVHFNAWWLSGSDKFLQDFFKQFRFVFQKKGTQIAPKFSSVADSLAEYSAALEPLPYIGKIAAFFHGLGELRKAREADINGLRQTIDKQLRDFPGRIVVIIDDLDRLRPEEIRLVFRLVKAVANFPQTIYLLAYDEPVVIRAVGDNDPQVGREYLDKIVQLPLVLPTPDRPSLEQLFSQGLEEILARKQEHLLDQEELRSLYSEAIKGLLTTPRLITRFLNLLRATYPLVRGEVNAVDFIGIQALRQFAPTVYAFIANNKARFCRAPAVDPIPDEEAQNEMKSLENALKSALESDWGRDHTAAENIVRDILVKLFPRRARTFGNAASRPFYRNNLREKCSVCSEEVFDRYFFLGVLPGELSEFEFRATMSLLPDTEAFGENLKEFAAETSPNGISWARAFLERLESVEQEVVQKEHIEPFLRAMYSIGDELVTESGAPDFLSLGNGELIRRVTKKVLKQLSTQDERFSLLQRLFLEAKALSTIVLHVYVFGQEHGRNDNKDPTLEIDPTIGIEHWKELQSLVVERLRSAACDGTLQRIPWLGGGFVLCCYADWTDDREAREYVSKLIQSDKGLCDFLTGFLWQGKIVKASMKDMKRLLPSGPEELIFRCEKILDTSPEWLTERHREALNLYVKAVERAQAQSNQKTI